jgi:pimeloyl-ACP methyl ester carboxylesterase
MDLGVRHTGTGGAGEASPRACSDGVSGTGLTDLQLPDGRVIGVERFGAKAGAPLLYFHGLPGSRLDFRSEAATFAAAGVELIAVDRPGFGLSTPLRGRSLLDWPRDVEALCDRLALERVVVLGYSSGGKYSLACAFALSERVALAGVLAGTGPPEMPGFDEGMTGADRLALTLALRARPLACAFWGGVRLLAQHWPRAVMTSFARDLSGPDRERMEEPAVRRAVLDSLREALRPGAAGTVDDYVVEGRPWGFDLAEIRVPVRLWHGEGDGVVPLAHSRWLAERIPDAELSVIAGAGHLMFGHLGPVAAQLRLSDAMPDPHRFPAGHSE